MRHQRTWSFFSALFAIFLLQVQTNSARQPRKRPPPRKTFHPSKTLDNMEDILCSCWSPDSANHSLMQDSTPKCRDVVKHASNATVSRLSKIDEKWRLWPSGCRRKEFGDKAFRQSVLSRGDPSRLAKFERKLQSCTTNPVTIVVFGGSETEGTQCQLTLRGHPVKGPPPPTPFLGLPPNITLPVKLGNDLCPWSNRLKTILHSVYPACVHIDIYNLASGATDQGWALGHLHDLFHQDNGTRGGKKLKDVVDLVVVDYAVNDGHFLDRNLLHRVGLKQTEEDSLKRVEAITEYMLKFILALPTEPAAIYLETGSPEQNFDASVAHLEGARRYGVPVASFRNVLSFPDDPTWETFKTNNVLSKFGFYRRDAKGAHTGSGETGRGTGNWSSRAISDLKEGPRLMLNGKWERSHEFLQCWGETSHPLWGIHALIAEVLYFFIGVEVAAAAIMSPECEKTGNVFKQPFPSLEASLLEPKLNPNAICPSGPFSYFSSRDLFFGKTSNMSSVGPNEKSGWKLISDRPGKFGWVLGLATGESAHDTITFKVKISAQPQITVEYMHSYEGQGQVMVSVSGPADESSISTVHNSAPVDHLFRGAEATIDGYQPQIRFALTSERKIIPLGLQPGLVDLHITLKQLPGEVVKRRGGSSFKIVSVSSC